MGPRGCNPSHSLQQAEEFMFFQLVWLEATTPDNVSHPVGFICGVVWHICHLQKRFSSFPCLEASISEQKLPFPRILENNIKIIQYWNNNLPLYSNTTTQHRRLVGSVKIITRAKNLSSLVSFKTTSLNWTSLVMRDFRHSWLFSTTDASGVE